MRYFFFSYVFLRRSGVHGYGNFTYKLEKFPTTKELKEFVLKDLDIKKCAIQNIFEFKSEEDYLNFKIEK